MQDQCCTVLIGDSRAHDIDGLDAILDDHGALSGGGLGPRLHAFDHQFPAPSNASAPQVEQRFQDRALRHHLCWLRVADSAGL